MTFIAKHFKNVNINHLSKALIYSRQDLYIVFAFLYCKILQQDCEQNLIVNSP